MRASEYFSLYFIPVIPMGTRGEYVRCRSCGARFKPDILKVPPEELEAASKPWKCPDCGNTNPGDHDSCLACGARRG
jgi:hypothetical protein